MKTYDFLIVGCGLTGATIAQQLFSNGFRVLIIDKRNHIGGNVYTEEIENVVVHKYGAHIFHTSYEDVWNYVNKFASFNNYENRVIANFHGKKYSLPFNMNTFHELWGVTSPMDAKEIINQQIKKANIKEAKNLEEQAISLVGTDVYKRLIKGYTEKQWGRPCSKLPSSIIKRIPVRFEFNNNYFEDKYQGIPIGGYTNMVKNMTKGIDILLNKDFKSIVHDNHYSFKKIIYTGSIDEYFDFCEGKLEYRTVFFKNQLLNKSSFQECAVMNFTSKFVPYTRIIEHKYFENRNQTKTYISKEFPKEFCNRDEPYYPINNEKNNELYKKYLNKALKLNNLLFKGRLGEYKYYDMDEAIKSALDFVASLLKK